MASTSVWYAGKLLFNHLSACYSSFGCSRPQVDRLGQSLHAAARITEPNNEYASQGRIFKEQHSLSMGGVENTSALYHSIQHQRTLRRQGSCTSACYMVVEHCANYAAVTDYDTDLQPSNSRYLSLRPPLKKKNLTGVHGPLSARYVLTSWLIALTQTDRASELPSAEFSAPACVYRGV